MDRSVVKWGGLMGVVGGVLFIVLRVLNAIHHTSAHPKPRILGHDDQLQAELEVIHNNGSWLLVRYGWLIATALVFFALITMAWSVAEQPAASWMRWAAAATIGAGAIAYVNEVISGHALEDAANRFVADPSEANLGVAVAISTIGGALYATKIATLFGVVPILFGMAGNASNGMPRLGSLAIAGGVVGFVAGTLMHFEVNSQLTAGWLPTIATLAFSVFLIENGRRMWSTQTT